MVITCTPRAACEAVIAQQTDIVVGLTVAIVALVVLGQVLRLSLRIRAEDTSPRRGTPEP